MFIAQRMGTFYGRAVEQLPYESSEGGYQGWHTDTEDLLLGTIGLALPRDDDSSLQEAILGEIGDDAWCDYDWLVLEIDESLHFNWQRFCDTVKHSRRFFFQQIGGEDRHDPDERPLQRFLLDLGNLIDDLGLTRARPKGYTLYRARGRKPGVKFKTAAELGPPPAKVATQSNRMNPPGIPMFYAAESQPLACAEGRQSLLSIGRFATERPLRLLDLATLPAIPGFFSRATRRELQDLKFLHAFADLIAEPIVGDDRTHIDYIPTQVLTEFLRDFHFSEGPIDGVRYRSATGTPGANVVLFAGQADVCDAPVPPSSKDKRSMPWLRLASVRHVELPSGKKT